jgi:hypothetical protein
MKKITVVILAFVLLLPSTSFARDSRHYPGPVARQGHPEHSNRYPRPSRYPVYRRGYGYSRPNSYPVYGYGYGYSRPYRHPHYDHDRYSDSDAAILGVVLGTAAIIGTVLVIDAIRNQPAPRPAPPPAPQLNP